MHKEERPDRFQKVLCMMLASIPAIQLANIVTVDSLIMPSRTIGSSALHSTDAQAVGLLGFTMSGAYFVLLAYPLRSRRNTKTLSVALLIASAILLIAAQYLE